MLFSIIKADEPNINHVTSLSIVIDIYSTVEKTLVVHFNKAPHHGAVIKFKARGGPESGEWRG